MNPFEAGTRKLIPAVLIYARFGDEILMVHRNASDRPGDYHAGKWNGLGGKCEPGESALQAAKREFREESGLDASEQVFRPLGTLHFPNFKASKCEDWLVFVFEAELSSLQRESSVSGPEGELHWVKISALMSLNLWEGDRHFIPLVIAREPFTGTLWYQGQKVIKHEIQTYQGASLSKMTHSK